MLVEMCACLLVCLLACIRVMYVPSVWAGPRAVIPGHFKRMYRKQRKKEKKEEGGETKDPEI